MLIQLCLDNAVEVQNECEREGTTVPVLPAEPHRSKAWSNRMGPRNGTSLSSGTGELPKNEIAGILLLSAKIDRKA